MPKYHEIKCEIELLVKDGKKLYVALRKSEENINELEYFLSNYEMWYSKAKIVLKQLLPDRLDDFTKLYNNEKRKEITFSSYTISDALKTLTGYNRKYGPWSASYNMLHQVQMMRACLDTFDSKVYNLQVILQADIFDSEIESAKHLLKMGFIRPAGAICGVVIEKHLASVCLNRNISIKKKNPSIADYNEALKDIAYGTVEWRKLQHLADVRNLCDHSKEREPLKEEVEELISGTSWLTKTIF